MSTTMPQTRTGYRPRIISSEAFHNAMFPREWLIQPMLVEGQPAVIGGPKKCLKTTLVLDMAISLGTQRPFLDTFKVPRPRRVLVLSGESGEATLQETAQRICRAKGGSLDKVSRLAWGFELPRLSQAADRLALYKALREAKVDVVFIDPLYLCLLSGSSGISPSNLYEVGPLLRSAAKACLDAGTTPVFIHHTTKGNGKPGDTPLELDSLAFAGIGEFARQWILINRREAYVPGSGKHSLMMTAGGSAGHSDAWSVDIDEGALGNDFEGREWNVQVGGVSGDYQWQRSKGP